MARCGCGGTCSCLIEAGDGVTVDGIGTVENPYVVSSDATELIGRLTFTDTSTVDFTVTGTGTDNSPMDVKAVALVSMEELTDVTGGASNGQVLVWVDDHWEPQNQSGGGGGGNLPPGGLTGQVLTKVSDLDNDADWETPGGDPGEQIYASSRRVSTNQNVPNNAQTVVVYDVDIYTDGIPWQTDHFTIPVPGYYRVTAQISYTGSNTVGSRFAYIKVNGSQRWINTGPPTTNTNGAGALVAGTLKLDAGDQVTIVALQNSGTDLPLAGGAAYNQVSIEKVPAPGDGSTVISGERNYASSRGHVTATSIPNGIWTPIPFDTLQYEDGIVWNDPASPGNQFLIPVDGYYQIDAGGSLAQNTTGYRALSIYQNSTPKSAVQVQPNAAAVTGMSTSVTLKCAKGDYIATRIWHSAGAALAMAGGANNNFMTITKVPAPTVPGSAASGVWPTNNIADDTLRDLGMPVYLDSQNRFRAGPMLIGDSARFAASTPVENYPYGLSVLTVYNGTTGGWPTHPGGQTSATVMTARRADGAATQWWASNMQSAGNAQVMVRTGSSGVWSSWMVVARDSGWLPCGTPASGWTVPAGYPAPQARILGNQVVMKGRLVNATFTGGYTDLMLLPTAIPNPTYTCSFPMGSNTAAYKACQILTGNGMVQIYSSVASGSHIDFASVRYPLD